MIKTKKLLPVLLALCLAVPAAAAPDDGCLPSTALLSETSRPLGRAEAQAFFASPGRSDKAIAVPALIIMAGAKAWSVIVNGRPSADLASAYASAIPGFSFNWDDLSGWTKVTRKYRFTLGNAVQGDDAVDITYEVSFYHGSLTDPESGRKGHYIANFIIKPEKIDLSWGWKVSLSAAMSDPMNIGSAREPVAMLGADLKWQYTKPFSSEPKIGMDYVSVTGLGALDDSSGGETRLPVAPPSPRELVAPAWD